MGLEVVGRRRTLFFSDLPFPNEEKCLSPLRSTTKENLRGARCLLHIPFFRRELHTDSAKAVTPHTHTHSTMPTMLHNSSLILIHQTSKKLKSLEAMYL